MTKPATINGVTVPYDRETETVIALARSGGQQRWVAIFALGCRADSESLNFLLTLLNSQDQYLRRASAEAIQQHASATKALPFLRKLLFDSSPYVVRTACETLSQLGDFESHDIILALLDNRSISTKIAALRALARLWRPDDFDGIFQLYRSENNEEVRKAYGWLLRETACDATWQELFSVWVHDPLSRHRVWACNLAEALGVSVNVPSLRELAKDVDGHVRKAAHKALQAILNRS